MTKVQEKTQPVWVKHPLGFLVSDFGEIRIPNIAINFKKTRNGYLSFECLEERFLVHRLVAECFIPNTESKQTVNHKDGNKLNNHKDNLEWATVEENSLHAVHELKLPCYYEVKKVCVYKDGSLITVSRSVTEAAKFVGGKHSNVSKCCLGKRKTHMGFTFRYAD